MTDKNCREKFVKIFPLHWFSVLLVVFVFVVGMMAGGTVEAAADNSNAAAASRIADNINRNMNKLNSQLGDAIAKSVKESLMFDVDEPVKSYDDKLIIEGVKNLKIIGKGESGQVTGELATGQKLRLHFYEKKYPLSRVNAKRRD